jgi:hypothetical protein
LSNTIDTRNPKIFTLQFNIDRGREGLMEEASTSQPSHGEDDHQQSLELLRLRVLATRKRTKIEREEGELSDTEPFPLSPEPVITESHYDYQRPITLRRKTGKGKRARFFQMDFEEANETAAREFLGNYTFSSSFEPQSCTIVVDSDVEPEGDFLSALPSLESTSPILPPLVGSIAGGLLHKELQKQLELLAQVKGQLAHLEQEKTSLDERFAGNEKSIYEAVQRQQNLKAQLKEAKGLIVKGKEIRTGFKVQQEKLSWEMSKRISFREALESSINAKQKYAELHAEQTLAKEATPVEQTDIITFPKSKRTEQFAQLEKQSLKVRQELMASQIALMQKRAVHTKAKQSKPKSMKKHTVSALGKVMGISPIITGAQIEQLSLAEEITEGDGSTTEFAFPERLYDINGHLLPANMVVSISRTLSGFVRDSLQLAESVDAETTPEESDIEGDSLIHFTPTKSAFEPLPIPATYVPYESPLAAFKSYRFSPHFPYSAPNEGILSTTYTNRVRPDGFVCTFGLNGHCTRPNCRGQHARSIFMDDASVLEDFMMTLLTLPVGAPFRDQSQLLTHVKEQFLKLAKSAQPLVALVGVLLDTFRMMHTGSHIISFSTLKSPPRQFERTVRSLVRLGGPRTELEIPRLDYRKSFLKGISELKEGELPRMWRYFGADEGLEAFEKSLDEDPGNISKWIEFFLVTLARGNIRNSLTLQAAEDVLKSAVKRNFNSELLVSLAEDFKSCFGSYDEREELGTVKGTLIPWMFLSSMEKSTYAEKLEVYHQCFHERMSSASAVDLILSFVKLACNHGQLADALALSQLALAKIVDEDYVGPIKMHLLLPILQNIQFSAVDTAYLTMMYFYVRDTRTFPQQSYLPFPLDMIRRLDFYYLQPWNTPESWVDDFAYLQKLSMSLYLEEPTSLVLSWCAVNMTSLAEKLELSEDVVFPLEMEPSPSVKCCLYFQQTLKVLEESDKLLFQSHPLLMLAYIDVVSRSLKDDSMKRETILSLLRSFWCSHFDALLSDGDIVVGLGRMIGMPELFPVSATAIVSGGKMMEWKKDPFLWMLAIMSVALLSPQIVTSHTIHALIESAMTAAGSPVSASFFLLWYRLTVELTFSAHEIADVNDEGKDGIIDRMVSLAENANVTPASDLERSWTEQPWTGTLGSPFDEFVQLNIPRVFIVRFPLIL